ncbi:hypothetical protein [Actinophytocola sp.]|uniref:hypothetical protein n=1 Tax=Actinophytocola sp. TaxID=1872138 RepID=UPI002ED387CD
MTTRSRPRGANTYTARLQQRSAAARRRRERPRWRTVRSLSALLAFAGEAGHLAAAMIEWPGAPVRGLAHVLAAAGLGVLSALLCFGQSRVELILGTVLTLVIPVAWFAGLYRDFPLAAAIAVSTVEVAAAALMGAGARRRPEPVPARRAAPRRPTAARPRKR